MTQLLAGAMALTAVLWTCPMVHAQIFTTPAPEDTLTISTTGQAEADAEWAEVNLTIEGRGNTADEAVASCENARDRAVADLVKQGVASQDIRWTLPAISWGGFMGLPMGQEEGPAQKFSATATLTVRINKLDPAALYEQVCKIVDTAVAGAGAGPGVPKRISDMMTAGDIVVFGVNDPTPLRERAVADAIQRAQALAQVTAAKAGRKLGPVTGIQLQDPSATGIFAMMNMLTAGTEKAGRAVCQLYAVVTFKLE